MRILVLLLWMFPSCYVSLLGRRPFWSLSTSPSLRPSLSLTPKPPFLLRNSGRGTMTAVESRMALYSTLERPLQSNNIKHSFVPDAASTFRLGSSSSSVGAGGSSRSSSRVASSSSRFKGFSLDEPAHATAPIMDRSMLGTRLTPNNRLNSNAGLALRAFSDKMRHLTEKEELTAARFLTVGRRLQAIRASLEIKLGRVASDEEWATACSMSIEKLALYNDMAKASRNRLVQHNLRIVDHWVRRLIEHSSVADKISFYELLVEGIVGLTKAAAKFDGRGVRFYEFAQPWVRSELYAGITRLRPGSFVSHRTIMVASRAKRTKKQLEKMLNRTVTGEEVASVLGMTPSTMESFIEAASKQVISIDTKISNKMAVSAYGDVEQGYQDLDFKEPAEPADMVFWLADFNNALDILDPLERRTLQYRYGLLDGTPKSIYTTADLMCMSVETVRLTIATAQGKLKRSPASSFLEEGRPRASTLSNGNAGQPIY